MSKKDLPPEVSARLGRLQDALAEAIPDFKKDGLFTMFEATSLNRMAKQLRTVLTSITRERQPPSPET